MNIKLKFEVGQEVWFLKKNRIVCEAIDHICMRINRDGTRVLHYHFNKTEEGKATLRTEDYLFASREELVSELQSEY